VHLIIRQLIRRFRFSSMGPPSSTEEPEEEACDGEEGDAAEDASDDGADGSVAA
jgi:hypothetical protein